MRDHKSPESKEDDEVIIKTFRIINIANVVET